MVHTLRKKFFHETIENHAHSMTFPIYQTGSFQMPEGEHYRYSRELNPTVEELSRIISIFESSEATTCTSSGMGAISTTLLSLLRPEKKLIIPYDLFGRTYNFAKDFLREWKVNTIISEIGTDQVISHIEEGAIVFLETVSNPMLTVYDIEKISKTVHEHNGILVVDSTLPTPFNINPLQLGADVVIHSLSKFMSGHNDLIGGSISGSKVLIEKIDSFRRTLGTSMDPNTAFLAIRGLKTLGIRMENINSHALSVSMMLSNSGNFKNIRYPLNPSHPDYRLSTRILYGGSGIVTFDLSNESCSPEKFMRRLNLAKPANTFGGVNSTVSHPWTMSHRSISTEDRKRLGITERTIRLSVGTEEPEDIVKDIILASTEEK